MQYNISKRPIKITDKNQKVHWGYHSYPVDPAGNRLSKYPEKKRLSDDYNTAAAMLAELKRKMKDEMDQPKYILASAYLAERCTGLDLRLENKEVGEQLHREMKRYLGYFGLFLKHRFNREVLLSEISTRDINAFLAGEGKRICKNTGEEVSILRGRRAKKYARWVILNFFNEAVSDEHVVSNPVIVAKKYTTERKAPKPFTLEQLEELLSKIPGVTFEQKTKINAILMDAALGVRGITMGHILVSDVFEDNGTLRVKLRRNKDKKVYIYPLHELGRFAYEQQMQNLSDKFGAIPKQLPLFPNKNGGIISSTTRSKWISKIIKRHFPDREDFVGKSYHSIRKFTANAVCARYDKNAARIVLMHKEQVTTDTLYLTADEERDNAIREKGLSGVPMITIEGMTKSRSTEEHRSHRVGSVAQPAHDASNDDEHQSCSRLTTSTGVRVSYTVL